MNFQESPFKAELYNAFIFFEDAARKRRDIDSKIDSEDACKVYTESLFGFIEEAQLDFFWNEGSPLESHDFWGSYRKFDQKISKFLARLHVRLITEKSDKQDEHIVETLLISSDFKHEIHARLNQIRKIVEVAGLPVDKKDKIYDKISALGREVDRERTRLGSLMANMLDVTEAAGKASENLDPLFKKINSLYKLFSDAKSESEQDLIEHSETKKLTSPDAQN